MSGIGEASLILGVIPIVISAVDIARNTYERSLIPFKMRKYMIKLSRALLLQKQTVSWTILSLVGRVYHGDVSQSELDRDPFAYLEDDSIQDQLRDFLGPEGNEAIKGSLREISSTLNRVARQLLGLMRADQHQSNDLLWIIEANQAGELHQIDLVGRVKLMLRYNEMKSCIEDLKAHTNDLTNFTLLVMNCSAPPATHSSRQAVRLARALGRIRAFATDLYKGLCRCSRGGICHLEHEASVILEDRIDQADDILRSSRTQDKNMTPVLVFQLIYAGRCPSPPQTWYEFPIQILNKSEDDARSPLTATQPRVRIVAGPTKTTLRPVTSMPTQTDFAPIDDFCASITAANQEAQAVTVVLSGASQMGTITTEGTTIIQQHNPEKVSLRTILSDHESGNGFSLRQQMLLASRLASSLLQLSQTRWLDRPWSKDTIYFLLQRTSHSVQPSVDFSRAFVSTIVDDGNPEASATVITGGAPQPKVVLLELGILLLEIWHKQTLEAHFDLGKGKVPNSFYWRLAKAMEWVEDMQNPPLDLYRGAILRCIKGIVGSDIQLTSWGESELWNGVCSDIIEPLSKNCRLWR